MCSGVAYYVQGLVIKQRGPVFVTAFNPLCMIITALLGSFILGEQITLGRFVIKSKFPDALSIMIYDKMQCYKKLIVHNMCFSDANMCLSFASAV